MALRYSGSPRKRGFWNVARSVLLPERAYVAATLSFSAWPNAFLSVSDDSYKFISTLSSC